MIVIALTLLALALVLLDSWTTHRVLSAGGREANPVADWVMARLDLAGWTLVKAVLVLAVAVALHGHPWAPWVLGALCALYGAVVVHNLVQGRG